MQRSKSIPVLILLFALHAKAHPLEEGLKTLSNGVEVSVFCDDEDVILHEKFSSNGADCSRFLKEDGKPGPLGDVISNHIKSLGDESQFLRNDLKGIERVCPKWAELTPENKTNFWIWFIAAISWKESTCGAAKKNPAATHGVAVGHLQLNKNRKDRSWRGGSSGNSCNVPDISIDENNIKCGLEILNEQLKGKDGIYEGSGDLFGRGSNAYWQALRTSDGGKIIDLVEVYPFCK